MKGIDKPLKFNADVMREVEISFDVIQERNNAFRITPKIDSFGCYDMQGLLDEYLFRVLNELLYISTKDPKLDSAKTLKYLVKRLVIERE